MGKRIRDVAVYCPMVQCSRCSLRHVVQGHREAGAQMAGGVKRPGRGGAIYFTCLPVTQKWPLVSPACRRLRLSHDIRQRLGDLSDKTGLASADLARLAIRQMVENPRSVQLTPERERA